MCPIFATKALPDFRARKDPSRLRLSWRSTSLTIDIRHFPYFPTFDIPTLATKFSQICIFQIFFDQNYVSCLSEKAEEDAIDVTHDKMRPGNLRFPVFSESKQESRKNCIKEYRCITGFSPASLKV